MIFIYLYLQVIHVFNHKQFPPAVESQVKTKVKFLLIA